MNLRDSLNDPSQGGPLPDPLEGREDFLWAAAFVCRYSEAGGMLMATSTEGRTLRLHNLTANTRSAKIVRAGLTSVGTVKAAVRAQLDAMPFWEPESDNIGPDPWLGNENDIHRGS